MIDSVTTKVTHGGSDMLVACLAAVRRVVEGPAMSRYAHVAVPAAAVVLVGGGEDSADAAGVFCGGVGGVVVGGVHGSGLWWWERAVREREGAHFGLFVIGGGCRCDVVATTPGRDAGQCCGQVGGVGAGGGGDGF